MLSSAYTIQLELWEWICSSSHPFNQSIVLKYHILQYKDTVHFFENLNTRNLTHCFVRTLHQLTKVEFTAVT